MNFDIFISHASEDKDDVARPLADELTNRGLRVWFDEYVLNLGDSLRREIDRGLASCRFGVVVLSESFFRKEWPRRELDGLVAREVDQVSNVILPVWHGVGREQILSFSPPLADKVGTKTTKGLMAVADDIERVVRRTPAQGTSAEVSHVPLVYDFSIFDAERSGCPKCGGKVVVTGMASESGEFAMGTCQDCGWENYYP